MHPRVARRRGGKPVKRARPELVSELLNVDAKLFDKYGVFDAVLNFDTPLFIDPALLRTTTVSEFKGSYDKVRKHFADLLKLLRRSKKQDDTFWREASKRLLFPEVQGLCIGFSSRGTAGSGSGPGIRNELLQTAKEIIEAGIEDPDLFEMVGLLQDNVGPDRISDMTAGIVVQDLRTYSRNAYQRLGAKKSAPPGVRWLDGLAINPHSGKEIFLAPWDILDELPLALNWSDLDIVGAHNDEIRGRMNQIIGDSWREAINNTTKEDLKRALLGDPDLLRDLLGHYRSKSAKAYDYETDPRGYRLWLRNARRFAGLNPVKLVLGDAPTASDIARVVGEICEKFKHLVENNLWRTLYDDDDKPRHEHHAQRIFFGIADSYCQANELDLSPEANSGGGPVDFKMSRGYSGRVLVEIKLTTNSRLLHGLKKQLPTYQAAESTHQSFYVVLDVGGSEPKKRQFKKEVAKLPTKAPKVIWVDATPKESASKV